LLPSTPPKPKHGNYSRRTISDLPRFICERCLLVILSDLLNIPFSLRISFWIFPRTVSMIRHCSTCFCLLTSASSKMPSNATSLVTVSMSQRIEQYFTQLSETVPISLYSLMVSMSCLPFVLYSQKWKSFPNK